MGDLNQLSNPMRNYLHIKEILLDMSSSTNLLTLMVQLIFHLGIPFTCYTKREAANGIFIRLDRALVNVQWLNLYPQL